MKPLKFFLVCFLCASCLYTITGAVSCRSYCDEDGYYKSSENCDPAPYCCGDLNTRYCCYNSSLDVTDDYEDVYICPNSSWWIFQSSWQVGLGMLGTIIVLLVVSACCCQCCNKHDNTRRRNERSADTSQRRDQSDMSVIAVDNLGSGSGPSTFDPTSPFAFVPPPYDSLSKLPPAYNTLFGGPSVNSAYQEDIEMSVLRLGFNDTPTTSQSTHNNNTTISRPPSYSGNPQALNSNEIFQTVSDNMISQAPNNNTTSPQAYSVNNNSYSVQSNVSLQVPGDNPGPQVCDSNTNNTNSSTVHHNSTGSDVVEITNNSPHVDHANTEGNYHGSNPDSDHQVVTPVESTHNEPERRAHTSPQNQHDRMSTGAAMQVESASGACAEHNDKTEVDAIRSVTV